MTILNITRSEPLPSPFEVRMKLPLTEGELELVEKQRQEILSILNGEDPRFLLIVGPCSIDDPKAAKEYGLKLKNLAQEVSDVFLIVMRAYFEKPRTILGWKGLLNDPFLNGTDDIRTGIFLTRELLLDLVRSNIALAAEFLDPAAPFYFGDLVSWGCIGARTVASQVHRQMASGLPMPLGFKNRTDGHIESAVHGMLTARSAHTFIGFDDKGMIAKLQTAGNPHTHLVLRGGNGRPNFDPQSIESALHLLHSSGLPLKIMIDCSHDNCQKQHELQPSVFQSVIHQIVEGNDKIFGIILESYLEPGKQPFHSDPSHFKYGVSLTDSCIGWETTEQLITWAHQKLSSSKTFAKV